MHSYFCVMPHSEQGQVLILVVMEDALVQTLVKLYNSTKKVLILVVMEDALVLTTKIDNKEIC